MNGHQLAINLGSELRIISWKNSIDSNFENFHIKNLLLTEFPMRCLISGGDGIYYGTVDASINLESPQFPLNEVVAFSRKHEVKTTILIQKEEIFEEEETIDLVGKFNHSEKQSPLLLFNLKEKENTPKLFPMESIDQKSRPAVVCRFQADENSIKILSTWEIQLGTPDILCYEDSSETLVIGSHSSNELNVFPKIGIHLKTVRLNRQYRSKGIMSLPNKEILILAGKRKDSASLSIQTSCQFQLELFSFQILPKIEKKATLEDILTSIQSLRYHMDNRLDKIEKIIEEHNKRIQSVEQTIQKKN